MESNAIKYELINKATGEVVATEEGAVFGQDTVTFKTVAGEEVIFQNPAQQGQLTNDVYDIREVATHIEPDGTGTVEVATSPEGEVEITHSDDAPETAGEAETVVEQA